MGRILKHPPRGENIWFLAHYGADIGCGLWLRTTGTWDLLYVESTGLIMDPPRGQRGPFGAYVRFVRLTPEQAQAGITCAQMGQWDRWTRSMFDA